MGNIKAPNDKGQYKVVASSEATGIAVRDPSLQVEGKDVTSVEDALLRQQQDIDKLKGNVSWLAKNGGGGNGGGGTGGPGTTPGVSEATCEILVNNNPTGTRTILNESGLTIYFKDISAQLNKNWVVRIDINGITIANKNVNRINNTIILPYKEVVKLPDGSDTLTNHAGRLTINASYEDDTNSIYGTAYWSADILEAVVTLNVSNVEVNLDDAGKPAEDKFINISYSSGVTGDYNLNVIAQQGSININKDIPITISNTNTNNFSINIKEFITNIQPGEYKITTTLSNLNDSTIKSTVVSTINFISRNLIISSATLSDSQAKPNEVSVSSSINLNWSCYGQGTATFQYDYIVNNQKIVEGKIGTVGATINDFIPIIGVSWATVGATVGVKIRVYTGDKSVERTFYFKFVEATGAFIEHHEDIAKHTLFDFKAYKFNTGVQSFALSNPAYVQGNSPVGISTTINTVNGSNLVGIKSQASVPPYLRFSNGAYGKITDFTVGTSKRTLNQIISNNNYEFSFNICFKADYHPDNNRTIFSIASMDSDGNPNNSIEIDVHNIMFNGISVVELVDSEFNDVCVTITKSDTPYINSEGELINKSKWICKIYTEGTLSAIRIFENTSNINNQSIIYIAGKTNPAGGQEGIWLTDCNIYSISFYDTVLNDEDILVNYINNKVLHTYGASNTFDFNLITEEARKSFCEIDNTNHITSYIYSRLSDRYDINFIIKNDKLDQDKLNAYAKVLGIPIVLLDVSTVADWTFNNFILQQSAGNVSLNPATGQKMQYYDPTGQNSLICELSDVTVSLQGTSTLKDAVKNINISLPATKEDTTVFVPKPTWLPEQTYTLKADVVDSSHSNNASIGKFINEVVNDFFPYSPDALANINESNYCKNQQPTATLKHTVEGFPVLLIMKFRTEKVGDISITPLGIYNFNLGRDAYRNLGFKKVNSIKKDGSNIVVSAFPFLAEHTVVDEEDSNANWIEVKDTYSVPDLQRITDNTIPARFNTSSGDFWQTSPNILNLLYEVRYGSRPNPADYQNFKDFVDFITKLPIEAPTKVIDRVGTKNIAMISGDYDKYDYINGGYINTGEKIQMTVDPNTMADFIFDPISLYRYFVIANIFGLVDNFGKNSTYRSWNNGNYYIGFYDMDTAVGGDNQGELTINPDCFNKFFKNKLLSGEKYGWFEESYNNKEGNVDAGIPGDSQVIGGGGISARANKIWLSIDTNAAREKFNLNVGDDGNAVESQYSYQYQLVTEQLNKIANNNGYSNFADYFINEFYIKQCGDCGPLLFNLDYRLKYLLQFKGNTYDNLKYTSKLHGRKQAYTKYWLNNRITFLDSLFAFKRGSQVYNRPNDYESSADIKYYNTPKTIPVKFSTPLLFSFEVGDASKSWYYAPKNEKVYVDAGSNSSGSVLAGAVNNSPQLLQIGDSTNKLSSMNVNLMGANNNEHNLNDLGFPLFVDLDLSNDTKLSPAFNLEGFYNNLSIKSSELRSINFANTSCVNPADKFELALYNIQTNSSDTKFSKLRSINISGSKCISKIYLPAVPLRELNIINSYIEELNLDNQNYLTYVDITGCTKINKVIINECSLYDRFTINDNQNLKEVVITNNDSIREVRITNCNKVSKIIIQNCPKLNTIVITPKVITGETYGLTGTGDSYLTLRDLPKLASFTCTSWPLRTFELTNCNEANITTFNITYLGVTHITGNNKRTTISYDGTESLLDLEAMKKANINVAGCGSVKHIQFPNDINNPLPYNYSFINCNQLKRIYGNIRIMNPVANDGCFRNLPNFSIHGKGNNGKGRGTWKGKSYINGAKIGTPWELIKGQTDFGSENRDFSIYNDITTLDFMQSGQNVTNIRFNGSNSFAYFINNTGYTHFDLYYLIAMIALTGGTNANMAFAFAGRKLASGDYKLFADTNVINRTMFVRWKYNIDNLRIPCESFNVPSPKSHRNEDGEIVVDLDNGLFSPAVEATRFYLPFTSFKVNAGTFRRKTGNYKLRRIEEFYGGNVSSHTYLDIPYNDFTDFFKNLPNLEYIYRSFNGIASIKWDTLVFPTVIKELVKCFKVNGTGEFDMSKVIPGNELTKLNNCFIGTGVLKITSDMYSRFTNLTCIGDEDPTIYDYAPSEYPFRDFTKTIDQETFPYDIFNNNPKLNTVNGVFANVQYKDFVEPVKLPGELFAHNPSVARCCYLFSKFRIPFTLTPNSFINCYSLSDVRYMFYQEVTKTYRGGPTGEIPYRLFYHGHSEPTKKITYITEAQYNALKTQVETPVQVPAVTDPDTGEVTTPATTRPKNPTEINNTIKNYLDANAVVQNYTYWTFKSTIVSIKGCFQGCVLLTNYTNKAKTSPYIPNKDYECPLNNYYLNRSVQAGKYTLDSLIKATTEKLTKTKICLGEVGDTSIDPYVQDTTLNNYVEARDIYTTDRKINNTTNPEGKNPTLAYAFPRDLLQYCTNNCDITFLFASQGLDSINGNINQGESMRTVGINGTIPADMLAPVPNITNFSYVFYNATNINTFVKNNIIYFVDPDFFTYAPKINKLVRSFSAVYFDGNVNLNVFTPLTQSLNIACIFAYCYFTAKPTKQTVSSIFLNNTISKVTGAFSLNMLNCDDNGDGVSRKEYWTNIQTANFSNNFTKLKLPVSISYVYYEQTTTHASDAAIPNVNYNY